MAFTVNFNDSLENIQFTALGIRGSSNYRDAWLRYAPLSISLDDRASSGTVKVYLKYQIANVNKPSGGAYSIPNSILLTTRQLSRNQSITYNVNIETALKNAGITSLTSVQSIVWYLSFDCTYLPYVSPGEIVINDPESQNLRLPATLNHYFAIPGAPGATSPDQNDILYTYNQFKSNGEDENIPGTGNRISGKVRFKFFNDSISTDISVNITKDGNKVLGNVSFVTTTFTTIGGQSWRYVDVTFDQTSYWGKTLDFTISTGNPNSNIIKILPTKSLQIVAEPVLDEGICSFSQGESYTIKPFTEPEQNPDMSVSYPWPFGTESSVANTTYGTAAKCVQYIVYRNSEGYIVNRDPETSSRSNDNIVTPLDKSLFATVGFDTNSFNRLGMSPYRGQYTARLGIRITNLFGDVFSHVNPIGTNDLTFDFNEQPIIQTPEIQWGVGANPTIFYLNNDIKLQDGLTILVTGEYQVYTQSKYTIYLRYQENNTWRTLTQIVSTNELVGVQGDPTEGSYSLQYYFDPQLFPVQKDWNFAIVVYANSTKDSTSYILPISIYQQDTPTINSNFSVVGYTNETFSLENDLLAANGEGISSNDPNADPSIEVDGYIVSSTIHTTKYSDGFERDDSSVAGNGNVPSNVSILSIQAQAVITLSQKLDSNVTHTTSKTSYSKIYNLNLSTPTVAYRANALGINTSQVGNQSIIDIHPTTDHIVLNIHGVKTEDNTTLFTILTYNTENGTLTWNQIDNDLDSDNNPVPDLSKYEPRVIDFKRGRLIGFTLGE